MEQIVYFADKAVLFTEVAPAEGWYLLCHTAEAPICRAKIVKILETHNSVAVVASSVEEAFAAFAADFACVEAAGGVARNGAGEYLMIYRNGRWDLPKGHVEPDEPIEVCAVREVEEETGVATEVVRPLCSTLHAYWFPKTERWELKRTYWYELRATAPQRLLPQQEEGITRAVWCSEEAFSAHVEGAFPTIRKVAKALFVIKTNS